MNIIATSVFGDIWSIILGFWHAIPYILIGTPILAIAYLIIGAIAQGRSFLDNILEGTKSLFSRLKNEDDRTGKINKLLEEEDKLIGNLSNIVTSYEGPIAIPQMFDLLLHRESIEKDSLMRQKADAINGLARKFYGIVESASEQVWNQTPTGRQPALMSQTAADSANDSGDAPQRRNWFSGASESDLKPFLLNDAGRVYFTIDLQNGNPEQLKTFSFNSLKPAAAINERIRNGERYWGDNPDFILIPSPVLAALQKTFTPKPNNNNNPPRRS